MNCVFAALEARRIPIIDALEPCAVSPSLIQLATLFHLQVSSNALPLSSLTLITIAVASDGQAASLGCNVFEPQEKS
jgi:hypothetical protein